MVGRGFTGAASAVFTDAAFNASLLSGTYNVMKGSGIDVVGMEFFNQHVFVFLANTMPAHPGVLEHKVLHASGEEFIVVLRGNKFNYKRRNRNTRKS